MTFGSLFSGIGGLDLGLERAGMQCAWQVEIDDYANRVLEKHWSAVRRWRDVRTFPPESYGDWKCDLICGGFPCQDISYAGKGAGLQGERSGLFYEIARLVRLLEPRWLLLENVAALRDRGLDTVVATLADIGFAAEWHCLPAAAFGAWHLRERMFIVANHHRCKSTGSILPRRTPTPHREWFFTETVQTWDRRFAQLESMGIGERCPSYADARRVLDGIPHRVDRLRGLGNAVVPAVAEYLGRLILEAEEELASCSC